MLRFDEVVISLSYSHASCISIGLSTPFATTASLSMPANGVVMYTLALQLMDLW